jgi:hypothetical protein
VFRTTSRTATGNYGTPSFASQPAVTAQPPLAPNDLTHYIQYTQPLGVSVQFTANNSRGASTQFYLASYSIFPADSSQIAVRYILKNLKSILTPFLNRSL